MPEEKPKVGEILPGQNWVELHGSFTPDELFELAVEIQKSFDKVPKRGDPKRHLN